MASLIQQPQDSLYIRLSLVYRRAGNTKATFVDLRNFAGQLDSEQVEDEEPTGKTLRELILARNPDLISLNYSSKINRAKGFKIELLYRDEIPSPFQPTPDKDPLEFFPVQQALRALLDRIFWVPPEAPRIHGEGNFLIGVITYIVDGHPYDVTPPTGGGGSNMGGT
jgi:hypothetical protein